MSHASLTLKLGRDLFKHSIKEVGPSNRAARPIFGSRCRAEFCDSHPQIGPPKLLILTDFADYQVWFGHQSGSMAPRARLRVSHGVSKGFAWFSSVCWPGIVEKSQNFDKIQLKNWLQTVEWRWSLRSIFGKATKGALQLCRAGWVVLVHSQTIIRSYYWSCLL